MLVKSPKKGGDWYIADAEVATLIGSLPGVRPFWPNNDSSKPLRFELHRSHLPLIEHPEASQELLRLASYTTDWDTRNERTTELGIKLRTTQHQAVDYMTRRRGSLLGDEMRLGKTLSAIFSHDPLSGKLVIIAPLIARGVWLAWLRRVFPDVPIGIMIGKTFDPEKLKQPIVFGHYDILPQWQAVIKIGTLVFDEGHALTNPRALRTKAAGILAALAERVIIMTGTPVWNKPIDLWSILCLIAPGAWGNYYDFGDRYGMPFPTAHGKTYPGSSNTDELKARLTEVMLRRLWKDCGDELPPITRSVVVAEVTDAERKRLDIAAGSLRTERTNTAGNLASYRRLVALLKAKAVDRELERLKDQPVVVWTYHRDTADKIGRSRLPGDQETNPPRFVIHGDISANKRDEIIEAWKATPNGVLVATMSVGQVAINLSHSKVALFVEIDWTPAVIAQSEMRTYDPTRPMDIRFIVANHIVDQRILRALIAKLDATDPLGVGVAIDTIDALRDAIMGPRDEGDLDRLLEDFLASAA